MASVKWSQLNRWSVVEKKVRIKKIVLQFIPLPLRRKILKAMYKSFRL